ncbi:hypothetical protein F5Y04DRAFT_256630 [Hypomontagnella monticulosa]|nr:hypothetical protein F5Y04DRAFT_256630 [Hypomontagnella monticulosa]
MDPPSGNPPPMSVENQSNTARSHSRNNERPRRRRRTTLTQKKRKSTKSPTWHEIRDIIDEKVERGKTYYLVDWEGSDKNGQPYAPSWEPEKNLTATAIDSWRDSKARPKHIHTPSIGTKRNTSNAAVDNTGHPTEESDSEDSEPVRPHNCRPQRQRQRRIRKQILEHRTVRVSESESGSESSKETTHKRKRPRIADPLAPSGTRHHTPEVTRGLLRLTSSTGEPKGESNLDNRTPHSTRGDSKLEETHTVTNLLPFVSSSSSVSAGKNRPVSLHSHQRGTQSSSFPAPGRERTDQGHTLKKAISDDKVVADSQGASLVSGFSAPDTLIPSHQPDPDNTINRNPANALSSFTLEAEAGPNSSEAELNTSNPLPLHVHVTQDSLSLRPNPCLVLPTSHFKNNTHSQPSQPPSPPSHSPSYPLHPPPSPSRPPSPSSLASAPSPLSLPSTTHNSATNTDQGQTSADNNCIASQQSNSQAAQIVKSFNTSRGWLVTNSEANFTVYDDDSVVLPTVSANSQTEYNSQHSSQALSELDGNTRSVSSLKSNQPRSQLALSQTEHPPCPPGKAASNLQVEEGSSIKQPQPITSIQPSNPLSSQSQEVLAEIMESASPNQGSARERLRLIRDRNFARLSTASPPVTSPVSANESISAEARADTQTVQAIEAPISADISPITPQGMTAPAFLTQPLDPAQSDQSANERQSLIPEAAQTHAEQQKQDERNLEDGGSSGVDYSGHEQQPETLDPSTLTLSIERDMDVGPSLATHEPHASPLISDELVAQRELPAHEGGEPAPDYPKDLLPEILTGVNEYVVTLPFYNPIRQVYNEILRDNEDLIRTFNASFCTSPYTKSHVVTIAKLDEMFSHLLDACDLPPFREAIASMTPDQVTKHLVGTNAKFAFVAELLLCLDQVNSDKKVLILVRPGEVMDLLGCMVESRRYHYIRSGVEIVGPSTAQHLLTVVLSSTTPGERIPEDVDVVVAFDHTYKPELVPLSLQARPRPVIVLTNICSVQHINMRIAENMDPLERKNTLLLAAINAMPYVENADPPLSHGLHAAAQTFSNYIQDPDDDEFYWDARQIPEDIFDFLHTAHAQGKPLQSIPEGFGGGTTSRSDQAPESRKRSHEPDDDDGASSKRPRLSQPTVVSHVKPISDLLRRLIEDDQVSESSGATISVSVDKLEAFAAKIKELEDKAEESERRTQQFRQLADRSKKEVDEYTTSINRIQAVYMSALEDRKAWETKYYQAQADANASKKEADKLVEKVAALEEQLSRPAPGSDNPRSASAQASEDKIQEKDTEIAQLKRKLQTMGNDLEYTKSAYQDSSKREGELRAEMNVYAQRVEELEREHNDSTVEVNKINAENESKELVRTLNELKARVRDLEVEVGRVRDENRALKENRRGTRQSSVPRSPRLGAYGVNSPRNGGRAKGGSSSRGTSPAPATGVFEAGPGGGTPAPNNRTSHLRESRY